tara:strand:+ start:12390 stop:12503 length:114 start_codon:yes stop_codon:yes gene_type:complete
MIGGLSPPFFFATTKNCLKGEKHAEQTILFISVPMLY